MLERKRIREGGIRLIPEEACYEVVFTDETRTLLSKKCLCDLKHTPLKEGCVDCIKVQLNVNVTVFLEVEDVKKLHALEIPSD